MSQSPLVSNGHLTFNLKVFRNAVVRILKDMCRNKDFFRQGQVSIDPILVPYTNSIHDKTVIEILCMQRS